MSRDNLDSMKVDNIASRQPYVPPPELGITPTAMEAEAPRYLSGSTVRSRLDAFRARARR
jgi:NADH dehydrogenase